MADTVLTELKIHEFDSVEQMSQYESEIGENDIVYTPDQSLKGTLFDFKWADHILNDISWLRADTFSWHSGDVYKAAYEHLANDINGKTLQSEVVGDITVQFYLADDEHKICPASEESNLVALYEATGIAWYYLLDQTNQQFKLPRTKWGFTGLRDSVGGYVEAGLPNITGHIGSQATKSNGASGAFASVDYTANTHYDSSTHGGGAYSANFDASRSNAAYGNSDTVQPPATQMYLYFYVGNFEQDAVEQTAGINAETLNRKADTGFGNVLDSAKELMANSSMPSGTYKDLTLGSSGSKYTAPADGWVALNKKATGAQYSQIASGGLAASAVGTSNSDVVVYLPVKAGNSFTVFYSLGGTTAYFRFIYAEGCKHLA
jgi:hypothetical protein